MFEPPSDLYRVAFDGSFRVDRALTGPPPGSPGKKACQKRLAAAQKELSELQRMLYAQDQLSVLLLFQAMDAAGKDSTIRAVMSGINPAGCEVYSFKQPSTEELDHDFLWRNAKRMPQRGRIGIFNRSHYEEVLVVRVHPEYLGGQRLPFLDLDTVWEDRFRSIRDFERHHAANGAVIVKFWLNVSRREQRNRFLSRIARPDKNWKFSMADVEERAHWDAYMAAYEEAINATSRPWAPWYAVPADDKPYMRMRVAEIVCATLRGMPLQYPVLGDDEMAELARAKQQLEADD